MSVHEYQSGQWTALVTEDALALLHPAVSDDVARELWQLTTTGERLGAWVEYLAAAGIAALPSFAMVEAHPEGLRVLVRGEVDVELGDRVVSGRGYATWREEVLPARDVTIRAEGADGGWLPVAGGIVRAASARLVVQGPPAPAAEDEDEDDVELTVARMPALAAAVGGRPTSVATGGAAPVAGRAEAVPASEAGAAGQQGESASPPSMPSPTGGSDAPAVPAPAVVKDTPTPTVASDATQVADDDATALAEPTVLPAEGEEPEEDADDYDFLLWSTEQVRAREATPEPAPPAAAEAPEPASPNDDPADRAPAEPSQLDIEATREPEPEPTDTGWAPGGIIDSVPGRPHTAPQDGAPVSPPGPTPLTDAAYDDGDHDGETIATSELPSVDVPTALEPATRPAPGVELVLSTGPRIEMDRPVLLGRAPEAARFAGAEAPRLVSVSNPERDISATHVEVRPAGGHVVVTDMNSTNGTVVHLPDQPSFRLQPGTGVPVGAGAVIELGVGVTATVQQVEGAP